jgi:Caspase domain/Domain of unknown function (DUF4384)
MFASTFICRLLACVILLVCVLPASADPKRLALLIGIGQYQDNLHIPTLEGPPNDVAAMRAVLVRRWGFLPQDIVALVNDKASRANIMQELAALSKRSKPDDEIVVYFSGHGTSALDSINRNQLAVPHGSGAFLPFDFTTGNPDNAKLIVGRRDLVPVFKQLEQARRKLWVISDSCYTGNAVRSANLASRERLPERMIPLLRQEKDKAEQHDDLELAIKAPQLPPYPYQSVLFLAAAAEGERARDIPASALSRMPTLDGKPHGAMTDALLRVLEGKIAGDLDGDGILSLTEVQRATADFMDSRSYGHTALRLPLVAEDLHGLGNQAVLSLRSVAAKPGKINLPALQVRLENMPEALSKAISGVPDIQLVEQAYAADILVRRNGNNLGIFSPSGDLLAAMNISEVERARKQVRQLAWARQLRIQAEQHRRGTLPTEIDPAQMGGNFRIGDKVSFVVRPDKASVMVLININSDGNVSVLYPGSPAEAQSQPGGVALYIPGKEGRQRIEVRPPAGMDLQFHFAFDQEPQGLAAIYGLDGVDPDDSRLRGFMNSLALMNGKFTFAQTSLRTLK